MRGAYGFLGTKGTLLSLPRGPLLWGRLCWVGGAPGFGGRGGHLPLAVLSGVGVSACPGGQLLGGHSAGWTLCLLASRPPLPSSLCLSLPILACRVSLGLSWGASCREDRRELAKPGLSTAVLGRVAQARLISPGLSREHSPPRAPTGGDWGARSAPTGGAVVKVRAGEGEGAGGLGVPNPGYFWVLIPGTSSALGWVLCQRLPLPPCDHP